MDRAYSYDPPPRTCLRGGGYITNRVEMCWQWQCVYATVCVDEADISAVVDHVHGMLPCTPAPHYQPDLFVRHNRSCTPVSYTHLTLPTIYSV